MLLSKRRKEGEFYFAVQHASSEVVGGEVQIDIFTDNEGNGTLLLRRSLYFEEQTEEHIDNFCKEFAFDPPYRKVCLDDSAHWCRVAHLYEINARILKEEQPYPTEDLNKSCRGLFHFIRRDLTRIENRPEYRQEMNRVNCGKEEDLLEPLALLTKVKNIKVSSACQGSAMLQLDKKQIYLPSCHSLKATIAMSSFPQALKNYLRSGPLGQRHLAKFEKNKLSANHVQQNKKFIQMLTSSLYGFLQKRARKKSQRKRTK